MAKMPKTDDREQSQRFVETARTLDVDESDQTFLSAVDAIVPARLSGSGRDAKKSTATTRPKQPT